MSLLSLEEAQAKLLALAPAMHSEEIAVEAARGRVLAQDLCATRTQPAADLSAMDGYALAGARTQDGRWRVVGESRAGSPYTAALAHGEAVRISTGVPMPDRSDRVLIQENARVGGEQVEALEEPAPGQHVRPAGLDFAAGDVVLEAGTRLGPAAIALALASGHGRTGVARRPRVAILETGDELVRDLDECGPGQLPASNGAMLAAMLEPWAGQCERLGPVPDEREALAAALAESERADILITSGGASVGEHDLVREALTDRRAELVFWKVAIRPGKPLMVATQRRPEGSQLVLGLPGNPVSSFVTAFLFALPLVRAAMGMKRPLPSPRPAKAGAPLSPTGSRRVFMRGISDGELVYPAASQDSSALRSLAAADCLIDRPANAPAAKAGDPIDVFYLHNG